MVGARLHNLLVEYASGFVSRHAAERLQVAEKTLLEGELHVALKGVKYA